MSASLSIAGMLAGICMFLAAIYSLSRAVARGGEGRLLHVMIAVLTVVTIAALWWDEPLLAQMLAVPLFFVAGRAMMLERRWHRIVPGIVIVFAILMMLGYVEVT